MHLDPTSQRLLEAVDDMMATRPAALVPFLARVLERHGVRVVVAALGIGDVPQVAVTVTFDDLSSTVVTQVVQRVLTKAGVPASTVGMVAPVAGDAASRWIAKQKKVPTK